MFCSLDITNERVKTPLRSWLSRTSAYTFKKLFRESKMSYSYYLVVGAESTYLIAEEFQVKYKEEHMKIINTILASIIFRD